MVLTFLSMGLISRLGVYFMRTGVRGLCVALRNGMVGVFSDFGLWG